ncbi:MAG: RidA family protein [Pirellulales bacterium]|nr:RidA family protein [Pirellulales bacterium]
MSILEKLAAMGLSLPPATPAKGVYQSVVQVGNLLYTSGHLPVQGDGTLVTGRLGADLTVEQGVAAAKLTGLALLTSLQVHLGDLNRVRRIVKTLGLVNCTPEFTQHPAVINGCSELLRDLWGPDGGVGARSAFGVAALPLNCAVEIELIVEAAD